MPNLQVKAESGCKNLNTKCLYDTSIHQPNENLIISYHAFFFFFFYLTGKLGNNPAQKGFTFCTIKMTTFSLFFSQCLKGDLENAEAYSNFTQKSPGM